jgi:hypothetical protein
VHNNTSRTYAVVFDITNLSGGAGAVNMKLTRFPTADLPVVRGKVVNDGETAGGSDKVTASANTKGQRSPAIADHLPDQ